jgi:hypothetical protein
MSDISKYGSEGEDETYMEDVDSNGFRHKYRDETWSQKCFTYDPKPQEFLGRRETMQFFHHLPSILQLFELFWPYTLMQKIVMETNRYATERLDVMENTQGGGE